MIKREEGQGKRLSLTAMTNEDLVILSTLSQDAIIKTSNMTWARRKRRFIILMNRFCWELNDFSNLKNEDYKRVNCIMSFDTVLSVKSKGIEQSKADIILSLLMIKNHDSKHGERSIELVFSGGGNITLEVECVEVILKDVSDPFKSAASNIPNHFDTESDE